jgi:hypothetical protein
MDLETIATLMRHDTPNTTFKSYIGITRDAQTVATDKLALAAMSQSKKP